MSSANMSSANMSSPKILLLAGTSEASQICDILHAVKLEGIVSFAGRVLRPKPLPLPRRVGGFGGVDGLCAYLRAEKITHIIDATHPFAAQMSHNACAAAGLLGLPLVAVTRAQWQAETGDDWRDVPDIAGAVAALAGPAKRVMLAIGRMHLAQFAAHPQHYYLLRLVDPPQDAQPFEKYDALISRGPFTYETDRALMERYKIDLVVSKNAGGHASQAKILAARALGLPVIMIARPKLPERLELHDPNAILQWIAQTPTHHL